MAANESIGGVSVNITGDLSDLKKSFEQAQSASKEAGEKIGSAFSEGAKAAGSATESVNNLGQAATKAGFSFRYAFFGVKDLMEGRVKYAVAEAANELVRMGGVALGAGIAIGAVAAAGYAIYKVHEYVVGLREATKEAAGPFRELNNEVQIGNDRLQVTNDKLANEIAKLQNRPQNSLKLALDEATAAAHELGNALDKDLGSFGKLLEEHGVGGLEAFFTHQMSTTALREFLVGKSGFGGFKGQIADAVDAGEGPEKLTARYSAAIGKLKWDLEMLRLETAASAGMGPRSTVAIEETKAAIRNLKEEQRLLELRPENAKLEGQKAALQGAKELARQTTDDLKKADEDQLAEEKSKHEMNIGMLISYWRRRLAAEQSNAERSREIRITLGNLAQEQDKMFQRIMERGTKLQEAEVNKARKLASELEVLEEEGNRLGEKIGADAAKAIREHNIAAAKSTEQGEQAAGRVAKLAAEQAYAAALDHSLAARIRLAQVEAAADQSEAQAKVMLAQREQELAETQEEKDKAGLALQEAIIRAAEKEIEDQTRLNALKREASITANLHDSLIGAASNVPGAIGGAVASGIIDGKSIGKEIRQSLAGIGKEMLGDVIKQSIEGLVFAITGNTIATNLNTIWTEIVALWTEVVAISDVSNPLSLLGFAEGGQPPVGRPSIIGERGPELFVPREAGTIVPNHAMRGMSSPGLPAQTYSSSASYSGSQTNNFTITGATNPREVARSVAEYLKTTAPGFSPWNSRA